MHIGSAAAEPTALYYFLLHYNRLSWDAVDLEIESAVVLDSPGHHLRLFILPESKLLKLLRCECLAVGDLFFDYHVVPVQQALAGAVIGHMLENRDILVEFFKLSGYMGTG